MEYDIRVSLNLPAAHRAVLDRLCEERSLTKTDLLRQALGFMQALHDAQRDGLYVGTSRDRSCLDTVFITPL
jgi:hypothetical protein